MNLQYAVLSKVVRNLMQATAHIGAKYFRLAWVFGLTPHYANSVLALQQ
jgi:hypothetical protein